MIVPVCTHNIDEFGRLVCYVLCPCVFGVVMWACWGCLMVIDDLGCVSSYKKNEMHMHTYTREDVYGFLYVSMWTYIYISLYIYMSAHMRF